MKIFYLSFTRFPSEKAHALYIAKTCEAFNSVEGVEAIAVVPKRFGCARLSAKDFYTLKSHIEIKKLVCLDLFPFHFFKGVAFYVGMLTFSVSCLIFGVFSISQKDIVVTNDALIAMMMTWIRKKVSYELHDYPTQNISLYRRVFQTANYIQTNNFQKKLRLVEDFQVDVNKVIVAHNGVAIEDFNTETSRQDARRKLGIELDKKIVAYTGHLFDWKGADILAEAMKMENDIITLFIGGNDEDVAKMKSTYQPFPNLRFLGFKPHKDMPLYQKAADVLVLPNSGKKDISRFHTSPMKVFEYMASGTPIVASNLPSIQEVLKPEHAVFFDPDNHTDLREKIIQTFTNYLTSTDMAKRAQEEVGKYDWIRRARELSKSYSEA